MPKNALFVPPVLPTVYRIRRSRPSGFVFMGIDPGTTNMAVSVSTFAKDMRSEPLWAGKVASTVRDNMNDLPAQYRAFLEELGLLIDKWKPRAIGIERFMNRGKFSGDQGEYVSMMLALIITYVMEHHPDCRIYIVQPGVWKTALNRAMVHVQEKMIERYYAHCLAEPHELDANLISHFVACKELSVKPFTHMSALGSDLTFLERFEAVATGKKKRKRK